MTIQCPHCHSISTRTKSTAKKVGQNVGAIAGTAAGFANAIQGATLGARVGLVAGPAGSVFGTAIGGIVGTSFDAQAVKRQLGIAVGQWDSFIYQMRTLAERKVKSHEAMNFFLKVLCDTDKPTSLVKGKGGLTNERALQKAQMLYDGHGRGATKSAAQGTAWGLLCSITEYVDHERRARSQDNRLDSAWFGQGAAIKQRALEHALQLVA